MSSFLGFPVCFFTQFHVFYSPCLIFQAFVVCISYFKLSTPPSMFQFFPLSMPILSLVVLLTSFAFMLSFSDLSSCYFQAFLPYKYINSSLFSSVCLIKLLPMPPDIFISTDLSFFPYIPNARFLSFVHVISSCFFFYHFTFYFTFFLVFWGMGEVTGQEVLHCVFQEVYMWQGKLLPLLMLHHSFCVGRDRQLPHTADSWLCGVEGASLVILLLIGR